MNEAEDPTRDEPGEQELSGPAAPRLPHTGEVAAALPGLARIAATTWLNATQWGVLASARTARRLLAAVRDPELAIELAHDLGLTVGAVTDAARAVATGTPLHEALASAGAPAPGSGGTPPAGHSSLRERGADLLARSRDVWEDDGVEHPAYARILGDLAPDEARILLLLLREGPQPSVDVRTGGPVGKVHSQLIAPGLTMIGARAGCRHVDRVPAFLNNLHRLGLVWFSREQLTDPSEYQVLEAQPDVLEAMHSQRFTKVVRRSIHLTPFGEDFVHAVLLPADDVTDYPQHQVPGEQEA